MSHDPYDYTGYGGSHHPLEQDGRGGNWTWELTLLLAPITFVIVIVQLLTVIMTPLGMVLAATGSLSVQEYGPLFSKPLPILVVGVLAWVAARLVRMGLTRALGGGSVSRHNLYSRPQDVR